MKIKIVNNVLLIVIVLFCFETSQAQDKNHYKKLYKQALSYADVATATSALNNLIVLGETIYKDTLATLYNRAGLYPQSYLVTKQLLTAKPDNKTLLELMLDNTVQLKNNSEALIYVDKLLLLEKNNTQYLYRKGLLVFDSKEYSACLETINTALELPVNPTNQVIAEGINEQQIAIPIQAALYNLKGLVYYQLKDLAGANTMFTKAIELAPEYKIAKTNLEAIQKLKTKQDEK